MISDGEKELVVKKFTVGLLATNCYLVYEKRSHKGILIDPGDFIRGINEYIKKAGVEVVATVNTHGHADHIMGDAEFGFLVMIHELDGPYLNDSSKNLSFMGCRAVREVHPGRFLKDGDVIDMGGLKLEVIHTPGHTPGGISLRCGNILFSGDTLFFEGVGRTDCPGGDYDMLMRSINEKLMVLPDDVKVLPGHGPETTIGHERRSNPFL
ncbi:MAG: MBL fold metallo-hydrolase [Candidatus Omnitrophica bacterium]|nr:MBL fold metallo-hydrolase [Candidatus Omnitrophota bacterium]MBU1128845.1 MBL fold metallo-hydrolase [Candidatus Omnitrophota bacterium]MBU1656977.1 MBL fold metallo-hydrolase [Candidatus Omnitrophota bacterium]MBU1783915.1 MBL fold metallo-hydrolase [Candidatus Omnitrophota bacterium]MBU1852145.1 MBL fold metallo-hydrolase [Candidatus Omnitrophota bacterium]